MLVLNLELVTSLEWRELPSSSKQSLLHQVFSDTVGSCSGVYSMSPSMSLEELSSLKGQGQVMKDSAVQNLS